MQSLLPNEQDEQREKNTASINRFDQTIKKESIDRSALRKINAFINDNIDLKNASLMSSSQLQLTKDAALAIQKIMGLENRVVILPVY